MNAATKLKVCNRALGCILILMLASGIQLEATSGIYGWSVWLHIVLGLLLVILSCYHIYLHYGLSNWFARFAKNRLVTTRILWWTFLLTAISGIAATVIWFDGFAHSSLGGVHGKIGFLMVAVAVIHAIKHRKHKRRIK